MCIQKKVTQVKAKYFPHISLTKFIWYGCFYILSYKSVGGLLFDDYIEVWLWISIKIYRIDYLTYLVLRDMKPMNIDSKLAFMPGVTDECSLMKGGIKTWVWTFLWLTNVNEGAALSAVLDSREGALPLSLFNLNQIRERSNYKGGVWPLEPASGITLTMGAILHLVMTGKFAVWCCCTGAGTTTTLFTDRKRSSP